MKYLQPSFSFGSTKAYRDGFERIFISHIPSCAMREIRPCPSSNSLHGEELSSHWWSGWPGAHCMKCGDEDKREICLADGCRCPCHGE